MSIFNRFLMPATAPATAPPASPGFDWLSFGINNIGNLYSIGNALFNKQKEKRVSNPFQKQSLDLLKNMNYNVNPQLAENRNTLGYGRNALSAASGGNGASYISGLRGMLTQKYMSDAGAYAMKQNMDNQYRSNYANALNQAGEMERNEDIRYNTAELQNSARRQDMLGNGPSQIGQNYQMQKNDQVRMNLLPFMFPGFTWNNMTGR